MVFLKWPLVNKDAVLSEGMLIAVNGAGEKVRAEILALSGKFVLHSRLSLETSFAQQYYFRSNEKSGFGFGCFGFPIEHKI